MKTLSLIRHSITEANARRLYYGTTDLPLNDEGIALCRSLAGSYALPEPLTLATSGMLRAEQTLSLLFGDREHLILPDMREHEMGEIEMRSYDEIRDWPAFREWMSDRTGTKPLPGGESTEQVRRRVSDRIDTLLDEGPENMLIVCHGGPIAHAMVHLYPHDIHTFYDWIPGACHGYTVRIRGDGRPGDYTRI